MDIFAEDWYMPARKDPSPEMLATFSGRFAVRLRMLRERAGLTIEDLVDAIGVPQPTLYHWEAGHSKPPIEMFPHLAKAFGIKVRTLLPDE